MAMNVIAMQRKAALLDKAKIIKSKADSNLSSIYLKARSIRVKTAADLSSIYAEAGAIKVKTGKDLSSIYAKARQVSVCATTRKSVSNLYTQGRTRSSTQVRDYRDYRYDSRYTSSFWQKLFLQSYQKSQRTM